MKHFKFILTCFIIFFSNIIYAQPDLILGGPGNNEKFILHTRWNAGYDFFQLTADDGNGGWLWNNGITFLRSNGNVGIGTTNSTEKLNVNGAMQLLDPNDNNKKMWLGFYSDLGNQYSFINSWDQSAFTFRNLVLFSSKVGVNTTAPLQDFDINGRLNLRKGVIQNGTTPITNTEDLGLYSQQQGYHIRIVSNQAPIRFFTDANVNLIGGTSALQINTNGDVGIGTESINSGYRLQVKGKIRAEEIRVQTGWADFVFKPEYKLLTLSEVEAFINENGHLPEIPNEQEVTENGVELGEMTSKLLQKIEELTLYVIMQQKEIEKLKLEKSKK